MTNILAVVRSNLLKEGEQFYTATLAVQKAKAKNKR